MPPSAARKILEGKTIKTLEYHAYFATGDMCIDQIVFTDGTIADLFGSCDEACITGIRMPDGTEHYITEESEL